ncbi:hypothetical protein Tco_0178285 [Tanacetum coccineum]
MDTELVGGSEVREEGSKTREESSSKRAGDELEQEPLKKQKMEDDKETTELQSMIYPLTPTAIIEMLNRKLQADNCNEMCYQLLKLMTKAAQEIISLEASSCADGQKVTYCWCWKVNAAGIKVTTAERLQLLKG